MENTEAQVLETELVLLSRIQIIWGRCCLPSPLKFLSIADNFNEEDKCLLGNSVGVPEVVFLNSIRARRK